MSQKKKPGTRNTKDTDGRSFNETPGSITYSHQPTAKGNPAEKPPSNPPNKDSAGKK